MPGSGCSTMSTGDGSPRLAPAWVRWAAIESVKPPPGSLSGLLRKRVADRRGRNIAAVAAARRQLEFVFYALRDSHVRALEHSRGRHEHRSWLFPGRRVEHVMTPISWHGRAVAQ